MRFIAGGQLQTGCLDLDEILLIKKLPGDCKCAIAGQQGRAPRRMIRRIPPVGTALWQQIFGQGLAGHVFTAKRVQRFFYIYNKGVSLSKVIASSLRKGNVVDMDGKLYVILTTQNIHPGKGTPVTQLDMRRISDGIKVSERYRTTETVERAFIQEHDYQYLYRDGDGYAFMNNETFDQITVPSDVVGDNGIYLQEGMTIRVSMHEINPVSIELPARVTLEITDTEPTTKGQTASSSYKPAILSNGMRTLVPPHIAVGTRIVILTEDGSYVERAKD